MSHPPVTDSAAPDTLGAYIRRRREAAGITQAELAAAVGTVQTTVSGWESDRHHPDRRHMTPLANALGVHRHELDRRYFP